MRVTGFKTLEAVLLALGASGSMEDAKEVFQSLLYIFSIISRGLI